MRNARNVEQSDSRIAAAYLGFEPSLLPVVGQLPQVLKDSHGSRAPWKGHNLVPDIPAGAAGCINLRQVSFPPSATQN